MKFLYTHGTGKVLTHWGPVTHICIGNVTNIGSHNRRRELALLKAEPGKNWNSFETFIFITLRGSSYKINQDPGREKLGRHFLKPFSRWPTSKIAKIKNKHNFGIINPMKLILVSNSMFLSMIYSLVYLRMHSEFTWPQIQYSRHPKELKSRTSMTVVSLSSKRWFLCLIPSFCVWSIHLCP